jgi:hypothetical protein
MTSQTTKLMNFVHAFGAARALIQKANREGALLEGLALYASVCDGFLRIGLVLKRQLVRSNDDIDDLLISQEPNGQYYTERKIQRLALNEGIITQEMFSELSALYDKRNDAIHKFFLTGLQYSHLASVLERYEIVYKKLNEVVYALEAEQAKKGVGMSRVENNSPKQNAEVLRKIALKIDPNLVSGMIEP